MGLEFPEIGGGSQLVVVNSQAGNYQAVLSDAFKTIEFTNGASDYAFTIPLNATTAFAVGTLITARKTGSGNITITQENASMTFRGVLGDVNVKIDGQDGYEVVLEKTDTDEWLISGAVKPV